MILYLIWITAVLAAVYLYYRNLFTTFQKRGVKNDPAVPVLGNMYNYLLKLVTRFDDYKNLYLSYPEERFVGRFDFHKPVLMIRDVELVKQIGIKDFELFVDRSAILDKRADPLLGGNLLSLKGEEWKEMRSTLSPAFTSSKMRSMLPLIVEIGEQMNDALKTEITKSSSDFIDINIRDVTTRFANDVIASCAFGLQVNSHADRHNEFYSMGETIFKPSFWGTLRALILISFPHVRKVLRISPLSAKNRDFFRNLVAYTMKQREENKIIRPDMINLLMDLKKGKLSHEEKEIKMADTGFATVEESTHGLRKITKKDWSQDELTAQAFLFFIAGFETVSTTLSFLLYELACNPEVQERLVEEIKAVDAKNGGKFDYMSIQHMTYMDMVVSEVLRMYPPLAFVDRVCLKDYNVGKPNKYAKEDYIVRRGEVVAFPVWGFHRDPQFFPEPHKFDPERFSDENKHKINSISYMPFGIGPRNCIGSRFALCEVKVMIYKLLLNLEVSPCEKTVIPMTLKKASNQLRIDGGEFLRVKIRK